MKLDNDTITQLGYNNNISERPQDMQGYDIVHQETMIFDEEFDLIGSTYSLAEPRLTEDYHNWLCDFINDDLNYFTESEQSVLRSLLKMHYECVYGDKVLYHKAWNTVVQWLNAVR